MARGACEPVEQQDIERLEQLLVEIRELVKELLEQQATRNGGMSGEWAAQ